MRMMLHPDTEPVPGYRLRQRLGRGGFGDVWEATAPDGAVVALKFLDARSKDATMLRGEIRILRALRFSYDSVFCHGMLHPDPSSHCTRYMIYVKS